MTKRAELVSMSSTTYLALAFVLGLALAPIARLDEMLVRIFRLVTEGELTWASVLRPEVFVPAFLGVVAIASAATLLTPQSTNSAALNARAARLRAERSNGRSHSSAQIEQATEANREKLDEQLKELMAFVNRYLDQNEAYSSSVANAQNELRSAVSMDQVRSVVALLVARNAEAMRESQELRRRLEGAKNRLSVMRERLGEVKALTKLDALTAVANRRGLEEFLEIAVALSHDEQSPLCVIMTDIDHFKSVNDRFGHPTGDAVLKQFASLLKTNIRSTDHVARYGGEEFTIVLPRTPIGNAYQTAERLRSKLQETRMRDAEGSPSIGVVTASFGLAAIQPGETTEAFLSRADRKLYEAKVNGRNRVAVDTLASA